MFVSKHFYLPLLITLLVLAPELAVAASGTDAAAFLDIPIGAAPAALGSAFTARATDAYAPVWNPAGLGFVDGFKFSGTESSYLQGIHYDYLGMATHGLGLSVQYLGSGDITSRDEQGNVTGTYSASFAAYSLAYGRKITGSWSVGLTAKAITESISDVSARSYAGDIGTLYRFNDRLSLAAVAANIGPPLTMVSESDPLPLSFRAGFLYKLMSSLDLSLEGVDRRGGPFSGSGGLEWNYDEILLLRFGMDSSHTQGLPGYSALTAGVGIRFWGQEFSLAWLPYGDLGNAFDFSLDLRFGGASHQEGKKSPERMEGENLLDSQGNEINR
jgi:hypothetical protein